MYIFGVLELIRLVPNGLQAFFVCFKTEHSENLKCIAAVC